MIKPDDVSLLKKDGNLDAKQLETWEKSVGDALQTGLGVATLPVGADQRGIAAELLHRFRQAAWIVTAKADGQGGTTLTFEHPKLVALRQAEAASP
jgi:hypothetical protein